MELAHFGLALGGLLECLGLLLEIRSHGLGDLVGRAVADLHHANHALLDLLIIELQHEALNDFEIGCAAGRDERVGPLIHGEGDLDNRAVGATGDTAALAAGEDELPALLVAATRFEQLVEEPFHLGGVGVTQREYLNRGVTGSMRSSISMSICIMSMCSSGARTMRALVFLSGAMVTSW